MAPMWLPVVLVSALLGHTSRADSVNQTEGSVDISQGHPLRLNCTYQFSVTYPSLFWYVQYPGQAPRMFLRDVGAQDSDEGIRKGFGTIQEKQDKSFHLRKPSVEQSDSATYYCAGSDTLRGAGSGAAQKPRRDGAGQHGGLAKFGKTLPLEATSLSPL